MFRTCWSQFRSKCWMWEIRHAGISSCPTLTICMNYSLMCLPHLYELSPNMFIGHINTSLIACPLEWLSLSKVSRLLFDDLSLFVIIFFMEQVSKLKWHNVSIFTSFTYKSLSKNKTNNILKIHYNLNLTLHLHI